MAVVIVYLYAFRYGIFDLAPMGRQVMMDGVEDIIITVDPKGKIIDSNKACSRYLEQAPHEMIGQPLSSFFPFLSLTSHYRSNERLGLPPEVTDPNGRTFEATVKDFKIGHSDKLGKLVILHDVSERKKMEEIVRNAEAEKKMAESNRKYRTVVDNQTEAIVSFLPDGKITFMNGIMERYLSYLGPGSVMIFAISCSRMSQRECSNR